VQDQERFKKTFALDDINGPRNTRKWLENGWAFMTFTAMKKCQNHLPASASTPLKASNVFSCLSAVVFLRSFRSAAVISYTVQRNSVLSRCIY